jgi:energy-coupling factor transporter ATP-binding protein EcfA2
VITQLSIGHFKAIASATIPLGPITVLVGPNDSGKSTILQALVALSRSGHPARLSVEQLLDCPLSVAATQGDTSANIEITGEGIARLGSEKKQYPYRYTTVLSPQSAAFVDEKIWWDGRVQLSTDANRTFTVMEEGGGWGAGWQSNGTLLSQFTGSAATMSSERTKPIFEAIADELRATLLRLDARAIATPSPLGAPVLPDGSGLVGIVDDLLTSGVGDEQIAYVNDFLRRLSPHVKSVGAKRHPASGGKELQFALRSGAVVPASQMSDGVVLAAALVLISLSSGTRRLLIEEPENGLHPRQLKVIADTIRTIAQAQGTQVILTTHSPLLLNHFAADEVLLVTRDQAGVHVQRMNEARGLDELASEMALGELWYNVGDSNLARPA